MTAVGTGVGSVLEQLELRQPKMVLTVDSYQITRVSRRLLPQVLSSKQDLDALLQRQSA
jgi:hypothetical protein